MAEAPPQRQQEDGGEQHYEDDLGQQQPVEHLLALVKAGEVEQLRHLLGVESRSEFDQLEEAAARGQVHALLRATNEKGVTALHLASGQVRDVAL